MFECTLDLHLTPCMPAHRFIVTPATVNDVVVAVQFAANHGLKVAARGTGHQLSGMAIPVNGVVVNMANLKAISANVAARTATVQACLGSDNPKKTPHSHSFNLFQGVECLWVTTER